MATPTVTEGNYILVTEKWQVKPEPKWIPFSETPVRGRATAKRIVLLDALYKGKVFDRETGGEIVRAEIRRGAWFRHFLRMGE